MKKLFFLTILLLTSVFVHSQDQMYDVCPLKVGESIPDSISLTNINGEKGMLGEFISKEKAILVFYRGGWCPYCTRHLSALGKIKEEIDSLGFRLYGITIDLFDSLGVSEVRAQSGYEIFSDNKAELITAFGLGWEVDEANYMKYRDQYGMDVEKWSGEKHHILPVPAVYVIENGTVLYNYVNPKYSVRLKPETLLAILRSF